MRVIRRHFLAAAVDPAVSLSTYSTVYFRWKSFLDHVDLAAFRCMHASMGVVRPHCQPLTYSHLPMTLFVDHVDHTMLSAPRLVDEPRPQTGMTWRWRRWGRGVADIEEWET